MPKSVKKHAKKRPSADDAEQARLHAAALKCAGTISGGDPHASEKVSETVRKLLLERYAQGRL